MVEPGKAIDIPGKVVGMVECRGRLYVATEDRGVYELGDDNVLRPLHFGPPPLSWWDEKQMLCEAYRRLLGVEL